MAKKEEGKQKLPKELQEYKKRIKGLDFKGRVKAYFDCSPFKYAIDEKKMDIVYSTFSRSEREEFASRYLPIYSTIEKYGDRIRAINGNCYIYANYIGTILRTKNILSYTADFLNRITPLAKEALVSTKEETTRKELHKIVKRLQDYQNVAILTPRIELEEGGIYGINIEETDKTLFELIDTLKKFLSQIKSFIESLKEFLDMVGTPELFPKEFKDMETTFLIQYRGTIHRDRDDKQFKEFPLFYSTSKAEAEFLLIDYNTLPLTLDIFGEKNIWAEEYKRLFAF